MRAMGAFWLQRARAQAGTLVATGLVVVVVAALASVMTGLAFRSPTSAVHATLAAEPAAVTSVALESSALSDLDAQDADVRRALAKRLSGLPVAVASSFSAPSVPVEGGRGALVLVSGDGLQQRVTMTQGRWPGADTEAAVDAAFARGHSVSVGDRVTMSGPAAPVTVTVVGVWRATDPAAPAWLGLTTGDGRIVVSAATAAAASDGVVGRWVLTPDARRTSAADLPRLQAALGGAAGQLSGDSAAGGSPFSTSGDGVATVAAMQRSVVALHAVIPVPLAVLAACSAIALVLLAQLLAGARRVETRLLRSRGVTIPALARATAVESGLVALAATIVGTLVAQVVLLATVGPPSGALDLLLPPLLTVLVAIAATTLTAVVSARAASDSPGAVEAGRGRTVVSAGLTVLAVVAAAVTLWRFVAFGPTVGGGVDAVDPTGVVAPAAVLCAIALVGLLLFGPASAAVERVAGRGRGVAGVLPARQVGRGVALFAGPVALIVLAVGSLTFAAGYAGTFGGFLRDSALLVNGASVRADLGVGGSPHGTGDVSGAARLGRLPGVTAVSPAIVDSGTVGDTDVAVVAANSAKLPALLPVGGYLLDTAALSRQVTPKDALAGAPLPSGAHELRATVTVTAGAGAAAVVGTTAWLATTSDEVVPVTATPGPDGSVAFPVPAGADRLVAVDTDVESVAGADAVTVTLSGLPTGAARWVQASSAFGSASPFRADGAGTAARAASLTGDGSVRFVPPGDAALPLAVTTALAQDDSLQVGQRIEVRSPAGDVQGTVAAIVPALPGTTSERAVFADLPALTAVLLRTSASVPRASSVWLAADDPDAVAGAVRSAVGAEASVTTASGAFVARFLGGAVASTWLGAAGCALLAVAAVAAAITAALRRRRGEVIVLRAVGLSGRQQAWARRLEVVGVACAAGVFGLLGGIVVVLLVGNTLARLSVVTAPSTLSVQGRVDPIGMAVGAVALAAALAVAVWGYGVAVRRQAADTAYREETR
ncbi:FtsX-like permease family protein [Leifsonia sp. NPDC056665]|uniref:FtsX-like permease family protein n=1 Tax=Leifsonia sp. NPDC056665 TaxID=3345901 RepID=UPI0036962546